MAKTSKETTEQELREEQVSKPKEDDLKLSVAPKGVSQSPEFKANGIALGKFENETQTIIRN